MIWHSWSMLGLQYYLNNLNSKLHGGNKLFTNLCNEAASFKMKLELFGNQWSGKKLDDFQHLKQRVAADDNDEDKYTNKVAERFNAS